MNVHDKARIDALQRKLGAAYATLDDLAELVQASSWKVERFLHSTQREHSLDLVEAGLEEIGEAPVFVAWPDGSVHLYSQLPREEWAQHANADNSAAKRRIIGHEHQHRAGSRP
jgi:hypothetical protein